MIAGILTTINNAIRILLRIFSNTYPLYGFKKLRS